MSNALHAKAAGAAAVTLSEKNLAQLPPSVARPNYDRSKVGIGIAHISLGAFHRAHQAVYTDDILAKQGGNWGILGIGARVEDQKLVDAMRAQDSLYTVVTRDGDKEEARVIGSIRDVTLMPGQQAQLIARLTDPAIKIMALTITEKGYCLDSATGRLDANHPFIKHDVQNPDTPQSAIALIVVALAARKQAGVAPFTVMSCDNLPGNGHKTKTVVTDFAQLRDPALAAWIAAEVAFPNTMVDRITPVTMPHDVDAVAERFNVADACPVVCEEFRQWVLEDHFPQGRPAWEAAGAQFVADVYPYELAKIRLLNVSHTMFAYPAFLAGYEFVSDGASDPVLANFVRAIMDKEITPTLPPVPGMDLEPYKTTLIKRFANPAIKDRWERICSDGSQKLANQLLPIVRERMQAGKGYTGLAVAVASWLRYLTATGENGKDYALNDPLADRLKQLARQGGRDPMPVLNVREVFGEDLPQHAEFVGIVRQALDDFYTLGTKATLTKWQSKLA
jgi:fructuronate reductase